MNRLKKLKWTLIVCFFMSMNISFGEGLKEGNLNEIIELAYRNNSGLASIEKKYEAEDALINAKATPQDPTLGISTLERGSKTRYGVIGQKLKFPTKYYYSSKAQKSRALSVKEKFSAKKLEIRHKVISFYYALYSVQKIIRLTKANMNTVREFSRVAERKYAAGKSTQADSMKAHFELSHLELEIIQLKQEEDSLQDQLKSVINDVEYPDLHLSKLEIKSPETNYGVNKLKTNELAKNLQKNSPSLRSDVHLLKESIHKSKLAKWEFAPDFKFQYQTRLSGMPEKSKIYSINLTIPLWFWSKGSKSSSANLKKMAQERNLKQKTHNLISSVRDLKGRVETGKKTMLIYKTTLIPQAEGAYNSSRASYRANKSSFLNLLDSERSLYRVKTGYYKALRKYAHHLGLLESKLGYQISNLGIIPGVKNER